MLVVVATAADGTRHTNEYFILAVLFCLLLLLFSQKPKLALICELFLHWIALIFPLSLQFVVWSCLWCLISVGVCVLHKASLFLSS